MILKVCLIILKVTYVLIHVLPFFSFFHVGWGVHDFGKFVFESHVLPFFSNLTRGVYMFSSFVKKKSHDVHECFGYVRNYVRTYMFNRSLRFLLSECVFAMLFVALV